MRPFPASPRLRHLGVCLLCLTGLLAAPAVNAATAERPERSQAVVPEGAIVTFGDVHGGADELFTLLQALGIIDANHHWQAGRTRLVSLGDLLDRGPHSRQVLELLMRLEREAVAAGGSLHLVLGNHEVMNLTGDLRYVSQAEFSAFAAEEDPEARRLELERLSNRTDPPESLTDLESRYPPGFFAHRAAFAADGHYGRWLLDKPHVLVLDQTAFVHGGLSEWAGGRSIDALNRAATGNLRTVLELGQSLVAQGILPPWQDLLMAQPSGAELTLPEPFVRARTSPELGADGPHWYRGTAACHPAIEAPVIHAVLERLGLDRIVMGHTPTVPRIVQTRFDGRAVLADTGMYGAYYNGRPSAVILANGSLRALTLNPSGQLEEKLGHPAIDLRVQGDAEVVTVLRQQETAAAADAAGGSATIDAGGSRYTARIWTGSRSERHRMLAARALDRLLGMGLVAPIVPVADSNALIEAIPAGTLSERARYERGVERPNWCAGYSDYDLMYALDTLLGIDARTADSLLYDPATWVLYLTDHQSAFPAWQRLPAYLAERTLKLPPLLRERLRALDASMLREALGEYVGRRTQRALLARRDLLLEVTAETELSRDAS